jgi:hypothetical protein
MGGSALPAYELDTSRWPLVVLTPTTAVRDPVALDGMYAALERLLSREKRFLFLFDMRGGASDAQRRKRFIDWVARHNDAISRYAIATAVVVGTAMERGFVTAATWVVNTPCPVRVFGDMVDAEAWLRKMAEKH